MKTVCQPTTLVLACGALVSELRNVLKADGLADTLEVHYLPAALHNNPKQIVPALTELLKKHDPDCTRDVVVCYADCGTGGSLAALRELRPSIRWLPGAHCYEFFASPEVFAELSVAHIGTFYLTDFLAKHFDALVWQGLRLDRYPELKDQLFKNYTTVVLLSQSDDQAVVAAARAAAEALGLEFEHQHTGLGPFATQLRVLLDTTTPFPDALPVVSV